MLPSFCNDVVTVDRAPLVEVRGTFEPDWEHPVSVEVAGCSFQPVQGSTAWTDPRQAVTVRATLYMPPNADVKAGDRITYQGNQYAIDGAPLPWKSPTGRVSHIQCTLIDWTL